MPITLRNVNVHYQCLVKHMLVTIVTFIILLIRTKRCTEFKLLGYFLIEIFVCLCACERDREKERDRDNHNDKYKIVYYHPQGTLPLRS